MALDKRKRRKVNSLVQKISAQRKLIRTGRIEGNREEEREMCEEISYLIGNAKCDLGMPTEHFEHNLIDFDTGLIECHSLPVKEKGEWKIKRDEKKQNELRMEIEHLRSGRAGIYVNHATGKRISEKRFLKLTPKEQKEWTKGGIITQTLVHADRIIAEEKGQTTKALELAALNGEFTLYQAKE